MNAVTLIFPHQLFKKHPALVAGQKVFLIEEYLYFRQYNFHKQKLVLHRASMKAYKAYLEEKGFTVEYIDSTEEISDIRSFLKHIKKEGTDLVTMADATDDWLYKRVKTSCKKYGIELAIKPTPYFLNKMDEVNDFFDKKKTYFQTDFYIWQRKIRNILIEADGKPIGGKWSFDGENRKSFPKNELVPTLRKPVIHKYVEEAVAYVNTNYSNNYGSVEEFIYPTNFKDAEDWLDDFLKVRFEKFGVYEDAMVGKEHYLYHSVLTPILNIGLLTPKQIIEKALEAAKNFNVPYNSVEGFIRQIMGWREFIRIVYEREGVKQRTTNYWGFTRKIPKAFWTGNTGIGPIDIVIKKILKTGYSHHIERLMMLGNFMLLCEFDPNEVYKWFMEMYVDSYDWVMVPNVYGMTQFADGGLMTTKPYISGSNYLNKMGDWKKVCADAKWREIWDGLFWRFMHVHRNFFLKNPRLGMLVGTFDKMSEEKKKFHLENAERYLQKLDKMNDDA